MIGLVRAQRRQHHRLRHGSNQLDSSAITRPTPTGAQNVRQQDVGRPARVDSPARPTNPSVPPPSRSTGADWSRGGHHGETPGDYARPPTPPASPSTACDAPPDA